MRVIPIMLNPCCTAANRSHQANRGVPGAGGWKFATHILFGGPLLENFLSLKTNFRFTKHAATPAQLLHSYRRLRTVLGSLGGCTVLGSLGGCTALGALGGCTVLDALGGCAGWVHRGGTDVRSHAN